MYRPCAPDGFIPNSVVREFYSFKKCEPSVVVKEEWKPPVWREEWNKIPQANDDDVSRVRHWLSDDEDDESIKSAISNSSDVSKRHDKLRKKISVSNLAVRKESRAKSSTRNTSSNLSSRTQQHHSPTRKQENKDTCITEEDKLKMNLQFFNEEQNMDGQQLIPYPVLGVPYPFLDYYNEPWFPRDVHCDIPTVIGAIIGKLETSQVDDLSNMLQCVIKTHRYSALNPTSIDDLLRSLFALLINDNAHVRQCAVHALRELGLNRNDVILALIPLLEDPSREVREEVKMALKEIAGIIDAATLTSMLRNLGKFVDVEVHDDNAEASDLVEEEVSGQSTIFDEGKKKNNKSSGIVVQITAPLAAIKSNKHKEGKKKVRQYHDSQSNVIPPEETFPSYQASQNKDVLSSRTEARTEDLLSDDQERYLDSKLEQKLLGSNPVPGVVGERIISGVLIFPSNRNNEEYRQQGGVIKSIPERHGCATAKKDGYTIYGKIGYQWTTYSTEYDMGVGNPGIESRRHVETTMQPGAGNFGNLVSRTIDIFAKYNAPINQ